MHRPCACVCQLDSRARRSAEEKDMLSSNLHNLLDVLKNKHHGKFALTKFANGVQQSTHQHFEYHHQQVSIKINGSM